MIAETLSFLAGELNVYLNQKIAPISDPRVKVGNVSRALDGSLNGQHSLDDKGILSLVNVEQDRSIRGEETVVKTATTARYKSPPLLLNLYVLASVNKDDYAASLILLGHMVQFFQHQTVFTPQSHPLLDPRIQKLTVELCTLNFEQVNHLWSTLGGKYLPSAMYKVRQITIDENAIIGEGGLIREIILDARSIGGRP